MDLRVLVVDDDDIAGGLSRDLLRERGIQADLLTDSLRAVEAIRRERYPLVVLDILMPGMDGLTLCHKIKTDPQLQDTKVVMVSGKSFEADRKRARSLGADLFIEKPYDVETFAQRIAEVAGRKLPPPPSMANVPAAERLSNSSPAFQVSVWGCRSETLDNRLSRYGSRSCCVSAAIGGMTVVFDAGSGLPDLGKKLASGHGLRELWLFLTHFHEEHVEGLGEFACARSPEWTIHVGAAREPNRPLEDLVRESFEKTLKTPGSVEAAFELHELQEETYELMPGVQVSAFYANHPGMTLGFILESKGRKLVYCPDSEVYGETATALQDYDEKLARLAAGADLLILDGRYTPEDYRTLKNNGHSAFTASVDLAGKAGAKRLLLFHHDSKYDDVALDRIAVAAAQRANEKGFALQVALAHDGLTLGV